MTQSSLHVPLLHALHHSSAERLLKAVEGIVSGAYTTTLTSQSEAEIRGFVTNDDGEEYGVVLSDGQVFCSCRDAMYRKSICKHAVVLALYVIRNSMPLTAVQEQAVAEKPINLKLSKVRSGFAFSA